MSATDHHIDRRTLLRRGAVLGGALALSGPLTALGERAAHGQMARAAGYGPLVPSEGGILLPPGFRSRIIDVQGTPMNDGNLTPGIFDGTGAFPDRGGRTILIRNHENRTGQGAGEIPVVVPAALRYDDDLRYIGGNTKLVLRPGPNGLPVVDRKFAVLGGTDTNCAGGYTPWATWLTCEEVVNRGATGKKHGYIFEVDANATGPHKAVPVPQAGRMAHEASTWYQGAVYQTEDERVSPVPDVKLGQIGACLYRYVPAGNLERQGDDDDDDRGGRRGEARFTRLARSRGRLQALKIRGENHANLNNGRRAGQTFQVEWVDVDVPDHDDDTNNNRTRASTRTTPTRIQAQDKGAAYFNRLEGCWVDRGIFYFDATEGGGNPGFGQLWAYDARRNRLTLVFQSDSPSTLENPDNVVVVPRTGHVFLQEDGPADQFVRGVTPDGAIYDFARTGANQTEFCGGCFDPSGRVLFLSQQGDRGSQPQGPPQGNAVTYAITGPWERVAGSRGRGDDDD